MSSQNLCPFCTSILLSQVSKGNLTWYCRHCHTEIPYAIASESKWDDVKNLRSVDNKQAESLTKTIFAKTVTRIKEALDVERVMLWEYKNNSEMVVIEEAIAPGYTSMKEWKVGYLFDNQDLQELLQGNIRVQNCDCMETDEDFVGSFFQVKARLTLPILIQENEGKNKLWGLLVVDQCSGTRCRSWLNLEIKLLSLITEYLSNSIKQVNHSQQVDQEYNKLQKLVELNENCYIHEHSKLDDCLAKQWLKMERLQKPLSMIMFSVDSWSKYKYIFGDQIAKNTLAKITQHIEPIFHKQEYSVYKNEKDIFTIILANTESSMAVELAKKFQIQVQNLNIEAGNTQMNEYLTVNIGVTTTFPTPLATKQEFLVRGREALIQAEQSRNTNVFFQPYLNQSPLDSDIASLPKVTGG